MDAAAPLAPPPPPPQANPEPPHTLEPISRPSSTSTQNSLAQQLPGISSIASGSPAASSPQLRATHVPAGTPYAGLPTCQNCQTSTTPLWRRDEHGAILCNACGLFLKLHNRARPISLKTDVIKSRNRVKTSMRPDVAMRKKSMGGLDGMGAAATTASDPANLAAAALNARRASNANGHIEGVDSPNSRTGTPNMYSPHLAGYPNMDDSQYHVAGFGASGAGDAQTSSPMNGDRADAPQTQEQLIAANASLKTRVAELEVINDFIQRRLGNYEGGYPDGAEAAAQIEAMRAQLETSTQTEAQLRGQLEESHRRENLFKRRLDEMEIELKKFQDPASIQPHDDNGRAKRPRTEDPADVFIDASEQPEQQLVQVDESLTADQPAAVSAVPATEEEPAVPSETTTVA